MFGDQFQLTMIKRMLPLLTTLLLTLQIGLAQSFIKSVSSPNAHIQATLMFSNQGEIGYNVRYQGKEIVGDYGTIADIKKGSNERYRGNMPDETPRTLKIKLAAGGGTAISIK